MEDLVQILSHIPPQLLSHPNLLVGIETRDDAAVYRLDEKTALIMSVDYFPPVVDDPFTAGAIAVTHGLSDIYAMGGKPLLALNITNFPADLSPDILGEMLRGGYTKAAEAGCLIVGGHTIDDAQPKYGLSVLGTVEPGRQITIAGAKPGDLLILTKPLGVGVITTAAKEGRAQGKALEEAISVMTTLNRAASAAMVKVGVHACTDITGFGFVGHIKSMALSSRVGAEVYLSQIPTITHTWDLLDQGVEPGGAHRNLKSVIESVEWHPRITLKEQFLLCAPETSGGLLMAAPAEKADTLVTELHAAGVQTAAICGKVTEEAVGLVRVTP